MIAATTALNIDADELWYDDTPAAVNTPANVILERVVNGVDLGYEVKVAALTGGTVVFELWWEGLSDGGHITAGVGGSL
jgi:hypothetical protein